MKDDELIGEMAGLRRYARKLTRNVDRAEDLLQDTMMRALAARHQFTSGTNLTGWLTTIMRNHFSSSRRRQPMISTDEVENFEDRYSVAENVSATLELTETLNALDTLPDRQREPIELAGWGFTMDEISDRLNIPDSTVKSRLCRGRKKLKEMTS